MGDQTVQRRTWCVIVVAGVWVATAAQAANPTPYAGWEQRGIKALSTEQIDDLRSGRAWAWRCRPSSMAIPARITCSTSPIGLG